MISNISLGIYVKTKRKENVYNEKEEMASSPSSDLQTSSSEQNQASI
jgi:hypothetical protein